MSKLEEIVQRVANILNSPSVTVVPVGDLPIAERGIVRAVGKPFGYLETAVKMAFGAAAVAAALAAAPTVAHADGVGWNANVYGQAQGQVMQQGQATPMTVIDVRPVKIELPAQQQTGASQVGGYAVTAAGTAIGAVLGNQVGRSSNNNAAQQVGAIIGGLVGGVAGNMVGERVNPAPQAQQVDGVALTLRNPATNQIATITQAGGSQFSPGDPVLVVTNGNTSRVVPDRSATREQGQAPAQWQQPGQGQQMQRAPGNTGFQGAAAGQGVDANIKRMAFAVIKAGAAMGVALDPDKVIEMLQTGAPQKNGTYVGKIVGVDQQMGVVFQDAGRGAGMVYPLNALTRVPALNEVVTVTLKDGMGFVAARGQEQSRGRG